MIQIENIWGYWWWTCQSVGRWWRRLQKSSTSSSSWKTMEVQVWLMIYINAQHCNSVKLQTIRLELHSRLVCWIWFSCLSSMVCLLFQCYRFWCIQALLQEVDVSQLGALVNFVNVYYSLFVVYSVFYLLTPLIRSVLYEFLNQRIAQRNQLRNEKVVSLIQGTTIIWLVHINHRKQML